MEQLNKKFIKNAILKAEELNEVVAKINETVQGANTSEADLKKLHEVVFPVNPSLYSATDYQNMLIPAWHKVLKKWIFLPYSPSSPPEPDTCFPFTFPFILK